jgi:hypothetical protein
MTIYPDLIALQATARANSDRRDQAINLGD